MKVLLLGPLPDPVTGVSLANETLLKYLKGKADVTAVNTISKLGVSSKGGDKFSLKKVLEFVLLYLNFFKIISKEIVYVTPGQTFFGVAKYTLFILVCRLWGTPYVIHLHGNYVGEEYKNLLGWKKKLYHWLFSGASAGIVLSPSLRSNFIGLIPDEKVYVVRNFVNKELQLKDLSGKDYSGLKVLYLSNLMREKGVFDVLEAFLILKKRKVRFKAFLAGSLETGIEPEVKEKLESLKPEVSYLGVVKGIEKARLLAKCNAFVFPTFYTMEGQPIALLEAMATGNIPLVTPHAGIPDVVSENNAIFVQKNNPLDIAEKLEELSGRLSCYAKMTEKNLDMVKEVYQEEIFGAEVFKVLKLHAKA